MPQFFSLFISLHFSKFVQRHSFPQSGNEKSIPWDASSSTYTISLYHPLENCHVFLIFSAQFLRYADESPGIFCNFCIIFTAFAGFSVANHCSSCRFNRSAIFFPILLFAPRRLTFPTIFLGMHSSHGNSAPPNSKRKASPLSVMRQTRRTRLRLLPPIRISTSALDSFTKPALIQQTFACHK